MNNQQSIFNTSLMYIYIFIYPGQDQMVTNIEGIIKELLSFIYND